MSSGTDSNQNEPVSIVTNATGVTTGCLVTTAQVLTKDTPPNSTDEESTPLLPLEVRVYKRRWYVLLIVSMATLLYNGVFATWGPIAQSAKAVYGWTDGTIALLINAGNLATMLFVFCASYLIDRKGLRTSMLLCSGLLALGTGFRVITTDRKFATWCIGAGQFINGLGGSIAASIPAAVSETWFPSNERTTATAIMYLSSSVGSALEFIIGPSIVKQPLTNWTQHHNRHAELESIRNQIHKLNLLEFGVGVGLLLFTTVYFPARPPYPPSRSATMSRCNFAEGLAHLLRQPSVWMVVLVFSMPAGVFGNWITLIDLIVNPVGLSQVDAGWLGFYASVSGFLAGLLIGRILDKFKRRMKLFVIIDYTLATGLLTWFALMCNGLVPRAKASLMVSAVLGSMLGNGAGPVLFELSCETAYPVGEGVTGGFIILINNFISFVSLGLNSVPQIGSEWMTWCLIGTLVLSLVIIVFFTERYQRIDIDSSNTRKEDGEVQSSSTTQYT